MGTRSIYRELGQHHAPLVRPLGEASRRAEPEPASGRASKLWLPTARVVDIGYCGYSEPLGGAGEGHTGLRLGLASPTFRLCQASLTRVGKGLAKVRSFGSATRRSATVEGGQGCCSRQATTPQTALASTHDDTHAQVTLSSDLDDVTVTSSNNCRVNV